MNVIDKFFNALPEHWRALIQEKNWFDLKQFNSCVAVDFEDGSNMFFYHAFIVHDKKREEIAIFTEHCGYFVLGTRGLERWQTLKQTESQKA